jgi:hypothetical protein
MVGGRRPSTAAIAVGAALVLGLAWLRWGRTDADPRRQTGRAEYDADAGRASVDSAAPLPSAPAVVAPAAAGNGTASEAPAPAVPGAVPRDAFDSPSWRSAKVAFRPRDLGRLGPYVQAGLYAARRDMDFCFRRAGASAEMSASAEPTSAPAADPQEQEEAAPSPRPGPAILLLYVEAREGALDVIDSRLEHSGTSSPAVVECCREVLRGFEIKAFNTVPGRRYRLKFRLQ